MDSLFANYASSDEEDEEQPQPQPQLHIHKPSISLFSSLPPPKSSPSLFSLSPPKSHPQNPNFPNQPQEQYEDDQIPPPRVKNPSSSSLFSSLPQPKSNPSPFSSLPPPQPQKKIVQFKLPVIKPSKFVDDDDDDDDEREGRKIDPSIQAPNVKSFLSSIPAPKNSTSALGALPSGSGSGRRSIIETGSNPSGFSTVAQVGVYQNVENHTYVDPSVSSGYGVSSGGGDDDSGWVSSSGNSYEEAYNGNAGYASYDYNSNWGDGTSGVEQSNTMGMGVRVPGKRGRNEIPEDIVEVKQDELIKNRPREDQAKTTGIAFGPAYQPVSTKGKPTKLHKRKHQIGSLYFDMRQKETELAERRSKGFLTKAETQAKYGW